jgi:hypothetical protein
VAGDAAARLYDVDEDSAVFKKHDRTTEYDRGTFTFHARKGKLIDLDKLHESIRATRLSGSTRSGLVSLEVTAVGRIMISGDKTVLAITGSSEEFVLVQHPDAKHAEVFGRLTTSGDTVVKLTGQIADYAGRWPNLLKTKPKRPRRLQVTRVEPQPDLAASTTLSRG